MTFALRLLAGAMTVAVAACSSPSTTPETADTPTNNTQTASTDTIDAAAARGPTMDDTGWSETEDGLRIKLELPDDLVANTPVPAKLHFRNDTDEPIRIHLITAEPFRGHQSVFRIASSNTGEPVSFQPEPRAHGIVIGEEDFHLIGPQSTQTFHQTLSLSDAVFAAGGGFTVTWTYSNAINKWEGGRETLDGPTKELFGGERIPFIWLGRVSVHVDILVNP